MSDRFAYAIGDAGIERAKAERSASVIFDAIHGNVATKADVQALGAELKVEIERGRTETHAIRAGDHSAERHDADGEPAVASHRRADGGARGPAVCRAPLWRARLSR